MIAGNFATGLNPYCSGQWSRTMVKRYWNWTSLKCLNPYCSGQWSRTSWMNLSFESLICLNPYCSGQWSRTGYTTIGDVAVDVLILIVVDNGLVP